MYFNKNFRICCPEKRIFISRDHNWAFSAWEIGRLREYINPNAALVHIDTHLDFLEPEIEIEKVSLNEEDAITRGGQLGIAEFIIPGVITGTIGKILMVSDDSEDISDDNAVKRAYTLNHYQQIYKGNWNKETKGESLILDLDLDFFNYNYQDYDSNGILPTDTIIRSQLEYIKNMMEWDMVTVALSPEYCGGEEMCLHLIKLFLDVFNLDIDKTEAW